jgi:hypothetical protein
VPQTMMRCPECHGEKRVWGYRLVLIPWKKTCSRCFGEGEIPIPQRFHEAIIPPGWMPRETSSQVPTREVRPDRRPVSSDRYSLPMDYYPVDPQLDFLTPLVVTTVLGGDPLVAVGVTLATGDPMLGILAGESAAGHAGQGELSQGDGGITGGAGASDFYDTSEPSQPVECPPSPVDLVSDNPDTSSCGDSSGGGGGDYGGSDY